MYKDEYVVSMNQNTLSYWLREYEALSRAMRLKDAGITMDDNPYVISI